VSVLEGADTRTPRQPAYGDVVRAFQEVGEAIVGDVELGRLLHLVLRKVCDLVDVRRGSLYLFDEGTGLFHGQVGVEADRSVDDQVKHYRCGVPADRFTQEILETRAPVLVADAQHDSRPVRSTMRAWEVRSILGVPMIVGGDVRGLLFLDDIERPHDFSEAQQLLASAFADMAAVAITTAQRAEALSQSMRTIARQNNLLRKAVAMEERLTTLALRGGTVPDIAAMLAELVDEPCAVHDARFRRIAVGVPPGPGWAPPALMDDDVRQAPEIRMALAGLPAREPTILGPFPRAGVHRRCLVVPIVAREDTWGYLLVAEAKSPLRTIETLVAGRAAAIIALNVTFQRSDAEMEMYAREALVRRLLDGDEPAASTVARAEFHGLRSNRPYVAAVVAGRGRGAQAIDGAAVEEAALREGLPAVWLAGVEGGALSMIVQLDDASDDLGRRFGAVVARIDGEVALQVAVSEVCDAVERLPAAHREATQAMRILRTFATAAGSPAILTAGELGPAALLLAATERADADRLVEKTLGPLADADNPKTLEVLQTLQVFLESSRGIRRAAARLHVHENTIRYRLGRLAEATGRDVLTDPRALLDVQVALLILRLEGRLESGTSR